jgi:hypothetical protein
MLFTFTCDFAFIGLENLFYRGLEKISGDVEII